MQYYKKPNCIRISQITNKCHSLHPTEHRVPEIPSNNYKTLKELCVKEDVGAQIDVSEYLSFPTNCFLQTISCMEGTIVNEKSGKNISPLLYGKSNKKLEKGAFCISRNASIGKISYVSEDINAIVNGGISYFTFKEKYKFYIPAFFITNYGEDTLKCMTSGGGTQQNVKRDTLLNMRIPFPVANKNNTQDEIIEYVSRLVRSLINKEMMIKEKVFRINDIIEKEMSKNKSGIQYSYPSIAEIRKSSQRLDTGLYGKKYKDVINCIFNYSKGYKCVGDLTHKWISGKTPEIVVQNDKGKYWWIAVGDIAYGLKFKNLKRYNTSEKTTNNLLKDGDILITRKGATVGKMNMFFDKFNIPTFVNEDIKVLRLDGDIVDKVFVGMFLNSYYGQTQMLNLASRGTKQGLTNDNILDVVFPLFENRLKKHIFKEYYNEDNSEWDGTIEFEDFDKSRNEKLGIYQINMEIFRLQEKLDDIVQKIVNNNEIVIEYSLK